MKRAIIKLTVTIAVLCVWQLAGIFFPFARLLVSDPISLTHFVVDNGGRLFLDFLHTGFIAVSGLAVAVVMGTSIACVGLLFDPLKARLILISTIMQSVPLVVFSPFAVIMLGVGFLSKIALAAIMGIFPIVIGTLVGISRVRADFGDLLELYDVAPMERIRGVFIPLLLPSLMGNIRVSAGLSVLGAIIAEFTGSARGLGKNIFLGTVRLEPELVVMSLFMSAFLGVIVHYVLCYLEHRLAWWKLPV